MADRRRERTSLLVFVIPPALAVYAALYSVENRALDETRQREPLSEGSARIYGQLIGPEGRAAPQGIKIALVREETLSIDSPAARRCCDGCAYTLFDERCDRAAQTIAELIDANELEVRPNRIAVTGSTGWFELDLIPPGRYAIFGAAPRGLLAFLRNIEVAALDQREVVLESGFRSSLQGSVISDDGEPLERARVWAVDPRIGRVSSSTTDADGRFEIGDLDGALGYYLLARAPELAPRGRPGTTPEEDVVLELEEGAALSGVVTHDGKTIEGAVLELDELRKKPTTGKDGKFRFEGLTPGYHVLRASFGGALGRRLELSIPQGVTRNLNLELTPVCTLRVRVENGEGEPIVGADVRLLANEAIDHRAAKTDDEGVALFEMMALSTYRMDARRADRGKTSAPLELTSGCISRNEKLVIRDSAGVRGVVNGEDGRAIGDVELSLEYLDAEAESADAVRLSRTDARGRFRVPSLAPGSWQLTAFKEGFVEATLIFEMHDVRVDEAIEVVISRGATIEGKIIDLSGRPVPDWTVYARGAGDVSVRPVSQADGRFTFSGLREGSYEMHAEPIGSGTRELELGTAVTATVVAHTGTKDVVLRAPGTGVLAGFVEFAGGPPPESFSVGLPGIGVRYFDGLSGRFHIASAIAAKYPIELRARGFSDEIVDVDVQPGRETTVEVLLEAAVKLRGRVLDASDGTPIAGAEITVLSDRRTTNTHKDGRFEVRGLPPGEHTVFVRATGYGTARLGPITIEGGLDVPSIEVRLERANAFVRGRIHAGKIVPAERSVVLIPHESEDAAVYESTGAGNDGAFAIDGLPPGPYTLIAAMRGKSGLVEVERRVLALPAQANEVDVDFAQRGGRLRLIVELERPSEIPLLVTVRAGAIEEKTIVDRETGAIDSAAAVVLEAGKTSAVFERMPSGRFTISVSAMHVEDVSLKAMSLAELAETRVKQVQLERDAKETRVRF